MSPAKLKTASLPPRAAAKDTDGLPLERSVGYQVRMTHRALQRYLHVKIKPHGVTLGTWHFLRALWHEDGLTQRELSRRIGTREPTTMTAIISMEASGLVRRVRNDVDRRKQNVFLTPKGRRLKSKLLPLAAEVVNTATTGFDKRELALFLGMLAAVQRNLGPLVADETGEVAPDISSIARDSLR
jgi:DNA-binding MarR family transcriptional regulator